MKWIDLVFLVDFSTSSMNHKRGGDGAETVFSANPFKRGAEFTETQRHTARGALET